MIIFATLSGIWIPGRTMSGIRHFARWLTFARPYRRPIIDFTMPLSLTTTAFGFMLFTGFLISLFMGHTVILLLPLPDVSQVFIKAAWRFVISQSAAMNIDI